VDLPDVHDRKEIFNVHLKPLKLDDSVDIDFLSRQTPGFSGADIANVCNEAALIAARRSKKFVDKQDFLDAVDRIIGGLEKKNKIMTKAEKEAVAFHEAGHATVSWMLEYANPLVKVTIVPRGKALGAAWYLPEERQLTTKEQLLDEMCATLGGRASEDLTFGKISTGALNDLERTNKQAYAMIAYYGMSDKLQNLCYYDSSGQSAYSFSKPYSEETAKLIDDEVKKLIAEQYERAKAILTEHKEGLAELAKILIEREVIFADDLEKIFGKRPWASRTEELMEANAKSKEAEKEDMEEETEKPLSAENGETEKSADETNESVAEKEKQDNGAENDLN
jgi:cell division protease FtsH